MKVLKPLLTIAFLASAVIGTAQQKYFTRNATIIFFSSTPIEDIKAENYNATAVVDTESGAIEFAALMKSFNFKKALMQEHFNENYVESGTYPKALFKGNIENIDQVNFSENGVYDVTVSGDMTIHGVTKQVSTPGKIEVRDGMVTAMAKFNVKPEDYDIEIPSVVRDKIANEIEVDVNAKLEPLNR